MRLDVSAEDIRASALDVFRRDDGRDRKSSPEDLAQNEDVGRDIVVLEADGFDNANLITSDSRILTTSVILPRLLF